MSDQQNSTPVDSTNELQQLINNIKSRDDGAVDDIKRTFSWGTVPLEVTVGLANDRATDALTAISILARYTMKLEKELVELKAAVALRPLGD